ncbi:hydrolase [Corynebacterium deserti GIMN1.010]|uniref:Hydrolase n=1 Tax=Corynebacterium deserti GIMN1.010 TaxID=931089 RepID=A0A0M4CXB2_9CORY|nr:alpha/beta hydrolase [Corynebacterium deserti]ALC05545.1 hydrolase [Corynebacterium deserti GIMN1.010]
MSHTTPLQHSTFEVPGASLSVSYSDEHGQAVVQLHGLTSSRKRDRLLDLDLGRGLSGTRLLRYDARGHGQSTGRTIATDYQWDTLATDLLSLLDAYFPNEQVHGVGPSMGCATLLHAATREPDRFSGFTLMLPPTAWESRAAQASEYLSRADFLETNGMDAFLKAETLSAQPPATIGVPDTVPDIPVELLPWAYRGAALSDLPPRQSIASLTQPTTILCWVDDPGHPVSTAIELTRLMPNSQLRIATTPTEVAEWPRHLCDDLKLEMV